MTARRCFRLGAAVWIAGGAGHFLLVDLGTLWLRTRVSRFAPHADLLDTMQRTALDFGALGETNAFRAAAGFSLWTALSLVLLGCVYLALSRQPALDLQPFARLGAIVSGAFLAVSAACFIPPATLGALAAGALFTASWLRAER